MRSVGAALAAARAAFAEAGIDTAALDARLLLSEAARLDTTALLARPERTLPADADARFSSHVARRLSGEPVGRILSLREFWGMPFRVGSATLEPRPDTETLVEAALQEARRLKSGPEFTICDLGTGTGAILIALLSELPEATGTAADVSPAAIGIARENAETLGVATRISFYVGDFAEGPDGPFDMVVSNPPYVRSADLAALPREVRDHDPRAALDGGADGLSAYRTIIGRAHGLLRQGGILAFEVGQDQAEAVSDLCAHGGLSVRRQVADLSGKARVVVAELSSDKAQCRLV